MRLEKVLVCRSLLLIIVVLLHGNSLHAQNYSRSIKSGSQLIEQGFYFKALEKLNSTLETDSSNSQINLLASICYIELQQPQSALRLINKLDESDECAQYYRAMAYYQLEDFEKAKEILRPLQEALCQNQLSKSSFVNLIHSAQQEYNDTKGYILTNFGPSINTPEREYSAVMINKFDSILFTSRRKESKANMAEDGMAYESIFITGVNSEDNWTPPVHFKSTVQSKFSHDATVQIFDEGKKVIIFHDGDLYLAAKNNNQWSIQHKLDIINTSQNETHCFITADQNTIYFSSDYLSENGDLDLYVTEKISDNNWSKPKPIVELNTPYDEDAPFLSDDGIFYFSSRGHESIGGFDVFGTRYNKETDTWAPVVNMGHPINTVADDIYYTTFGKLAYLSSSRLGGEGLLDLYRIFLFNKIKMTGKIINQNNQEPIPGATIDFEYGPWFLRGHSDIDGKYEMHVPINKNMRVTIQKDSTSLHEGNYMVKVFLDDENNNQYNFSVDIDPEQGDEPVLSTDLLSMSDTVLIKLQVKNDLGKNDIINKVAPADEKQWVDSLNALYGSRFSYVDTDAADEDLTMVYFDFNSSSLFDSAIFILNKFMEQISGQKYSYIEIGGHTDDKGSDRYNLLLSIKRAEAVANFMANKGFSKNKMIVKGFGKKKPLVKDSTEYASVANRRVELKLIK